jgi:hypothetical protein
MGKTRDTGKLATQIQFDNNNNLIIGSSPSSILDISGSIEALTITGSFTGSVYGIGDVVSFSASVNSDLNSIHNTTSSNITKITNLENKTGSLASTGSNTFYGTQTISGTVYIANDLIVQGSSSIQYITGSSVSIGTNIVSLNTAFPSVRYAGLSIVDSGSIGGSGSFLYDSVQDEFVFVHRGDGTNVTSSHFVLGPETYNDLGNELYLTCNRLSKGTGKEHLVDSNIFDNGTTICLTGNTIGTGTACFGGQICAQSSTFTYNSGQPALNIRASDNNFSLMSIFGNQSGDVSWLLMSGYPAAGDFTIRQSDVVNALTIKKTNGIACFASKICAPALTTCYLRMSDELTFGLSMCKSPGGYPMIQSDLGQSIGFYNGEGGGTYSERMRIWQTGIITIGCHVCLGSGTDTPVNPNKGLYISNNGTTALIIRDSTNDSEFTTQVQSTGTILGTLTNNDLIIYSCNTERMRIANNGVTALCIDSAIVMAKGTVAQRPTPVSGMLRYNSDYNLMEFYNGACWVQMGSGDLATGFCFNNLSMCHDVYRAAGTLGLQGQGSGCISLYGAAAPSMPTSNTGYQFATHGGHCGVSDYPGYWGVNLAAAKAVNQLKVWIHANSWGYFELQGSNNSGNASGFATNGTWTTLSFLCSNSGNYQNMGGNSSGCSDGTVFTFWYTNNVPFQAYRIKVLDSSRPTQALGTTYAGSAGYIWQLNRV